MQRSPLVRKVEEFLRPPDGRDGGMVVGVSGGPDSVALVRALTVLWSFTGGKPLVMAHLNHLLRGEESDADEAFVKAFHADLVAAGASTLELWCDRADVAGQARKEGANLENTARQVRYHWLAQVARERGLRCVATAHTADDQAETVLHHLLRGTGLKGMRGIARRRPLGPDVELVRPLLRVTRQEVVDYLEAERQTYREDRSNFDLGRTRNRIRHELLPQLMERYNPGLVSVLCRLAEQAGEAFRHDEAEAEALLVKAEGARAGRLLIFDRPCLAAASRHGIREMFRLLWVREGWPLVGMGFEDWDRLAAVALGEAVSVDFPGGIRARCKERVVQVGMV